MIWSAQRSCCIAVTGVCSWISSAGMSTRKLGLFRSLDLALAALRARLVPLAVRRGPDPEEDQMPDGGLS